MEEMLESLKFCIEQRNWQAVLVMALTLPDICGYHSYGGDTRSRYVTWFDQYAKDRFTLRHFLSRHAPDHIDPRGVSNKPFLEGDDCYALRCALLHEGQTNTANQRASKIFEDYYFLTPRTGGNIIHLNLNPRTKTLQLQIDEFATDILEAAITWWNTLDSKKKTEVNKKTLIVHRSGEINF